VCKYFSVVRVVYFLRQDALCRSARVLIRCTGTSCRFRRPGPFLDLRLTRYEYASLSRLAARASGFWVAIRFVADATHLPHRVCMVGLWSARTFAIWRSGTDTSVHIRRARRNPSPRVAISLAVPSIQQQERFKAFLKIPLRAVVGAVT